MKQTKRWGIEGAGCAGEKRLKGTDASWQAHTNKSRPLLVTFLLLYVPSLSIGYTDCENEQVKNCQKHNYPLSTFSPHHAKNPRHSNDSCFYPNMTAQQEKSK